MKTKVLLSLSAAALVNAAQLSAAPQISSGAYAGVAAGVSVLGGKNGFTYSNDSVAAGNQVIQNQANFSLSKTSPALTMFGGYGMKVSDFWAAAELFYQLDRLRDKQNPVFGANEPTSLKTSSAGAYGAAVHLGFLPSENCVAYAILGIEARRFKVQFSDPVDTNIAAKIRKNYTSIAFTPGFGVRFALTKKLSLRTEYKYAMHRKKTMSSSVHNANPPGYDDMVTLKHQPKVQTFSVGVVYNF